MNGKNARGKTNVNEEQYKIEYCLNGLYISKLLSYDFIKKKDTREIVLSLNILIATDIHNHFYK